MPRVVPVLCTLALVLVSVAPSFAEDDAVVIEGVGTAHGMGLAMDGVLGQARAGWKYRDILSLFYAGTKPAKASGTVRVGLAEGAEHTIELPSGGEVTDAAPGAAAGAGFPLHVPAGATVVVGRTAEVYLVRAPGLVGAAQTEIVPVPTPTPSAPVPSPSPSPPPAPPPSPPEPGHLAPLASRNPIWVTPSGLMRLGATGRRYRGRMQLREASGTVWAINHVELETYVRGIAEEKGAGWPVEGLKVLAVAARSLAAATMQWYTRHHANGFDICPTGRCQVYLGADGEEPAMTQAVKATAGEIVQHAGRPILAMYHGNGGGRTESYRLLYGDGSSDPYPYLSSVAYPFANPLAWQQSFPRSAVLSALASKGFVVPGKLERIEVVERGHSPRVRRVRVEGAKGAVELTGLQLQGALGLPSAWFDVRSGAAAPTSAAPVEADGPQEAFAFEPLEPAPRSYDRATAPASRRPDVLALAVLGIAAALLASTTRGPGSRASPSERADC